MNSSISIEHEIERLYDRNWAVLAAERCAACGIDGRKWQGGRPATVEDGKRETIQAPFSTVAVLLHDDYFCLNQWGGQRELRH